MWTIVEVAAHWAVSVLLTTAEADTNAKQHTGMDHRTYEGRRMGP